MFYVENVVKVVFMDVFKNIGIVNFIGSWFVVFGVIVNLEVSDFFLVFFDIR